MTKPAALLATLTIAALGLAACGDDGGDSTTAASTDQVNTFTTTTADESFAVAADPSNLAYTETDLSVPAGSVTVDFENPSSIPHDVVVEDADGLFAVITKNITDKAVRFEGAAAPTVSGANTGSIYYDLIANQFKVSQNGGAYVNLINTLAPSGTTNSVQINNGGGNLDGNASFLYDPLTATASLGSAALTGTLRLLASPSGNPVSITVNAPVLQKLILPDALPSGAGQALSVASLAGSNITLGWATPGGVPGGSGSELQYRGGASTFAAVTGSSVGTNGEVVLAPTARTSGSLSRAAATRALTSPAWPPQAPQSSPLP